MNKQEFADKWSLEEWQELCKNQEFVESFWHDDFDECREIAKVELGW
jgi:hypothetical protein